MEGYSITKINVVKSSQSLKKLNTTKITIIANIPVIKASDVTIKNPKIISIEVGHFLIIVNMNRMNRTGERMMKVIGKITANMIRIAGMIGHTKQRTNPRKKTPKRKISKSFIVIFYHASYSSQAAK